MAQQGLLCSVYRNPLGDCTNGGISSVVSGATLIGEDVPEIFEPTDRSPALFLREFRGQAIAVPEPLELRAGMKTVAGLNGWQFGGNFLYTSDGRFPSAQPIKIFDRREPKP